MLWFWLKTKYSEHFHSNKSGFVCSENTFNNNITKIFCNSTFWYVSHVVDLRLGDQPPYCVTYLWKVVAVETIHGWTKTRIQWPEEVVLLKVLQEEACGRSWRLSRICPLPWLITMPLVNKVRKSGCLCASFPTIPSEGFFISSPPSSSFKSLCLSFFSWRCWEFLCHPLSSLLIMTYNC